MADRKTTTKSKPQESRSRQSRRTQKTEKRIKRPDTDNSHATESTWRELAECVAEMRRRMVNWLVVVFSTKQPCHQGDPKCKNWSVDTQKTWLGRPANCRAPPTISTAFTVINTRKNSNRLQPSKTRTLFEPRTSRKTECSVSAVDTETGQTVAFLEFDNGVEEIFDGQILRGVRVPAVVGFSKETIHRACVITRSEPSTATRPEKRSRVESRESTASRRRPATCGSAPAASHSQATDRKILPVVPGRT